MSSKARRPRPTFSWLHWRLPNGRAGKLGPFLATEIPPLIPRDPQPGSLFWAEPVAR